ncbi:MAG: hypothetical protein WDA47_01710 [Bacilli bacterium]
MAAATTMLDLRRQDQMRTLWTPYWLTSSEVYGPDADDKAAVVFSFPAAVFGTRLIKVLECAFQVVTPYAGGSVSINVGLGTIATDAAVDGDTVTEVDEDEYIATAHITEGTAALYWCQASDWLTAKLLGTNQSNEIITPADATVPCVVVYVTSDAAITAGAGRVLMQVVEVPKF